MKEVSFPGNNEEKPTARLLLYKEAKTAPRWGSAVTLAGSDPAAEIQLLRDYLRWSPERTWFVDKSSKEDVQVALARIRREWPEANVRNDKLQNVLPRLEHIGFAHLDFMGYMNDDVLPCVRSTAERMISGGVLGFTWYRGRELKAHKSIRRTWRAGRGFRGNDRRWAGVLRLIDQLTAGSLHLIHAVEYHNTCSPMSMIVFRKR